MFSCLKRPTALAGSSLFLIVMIAGCGGTTSSQTSASPRVRFNGKTASIPLSSQFSGSTLPRAYTCDGRDELPPFTWGALPPGTKQLALFILGFTRSETRTRIQIRYALAGLSPTLQGIQAGRLPPGAIPGRSSSGHTKYSLCPAKGTAENYAFLLYALPNKLRIHRGFNSAQLLSRVDSPHSTTSFGAFLTAYARP